MKLLFYVDESGNSGDAVPKKNNDPFSGQPSFSLAGVGFPEEINVDSWLQDLKKKYKIQAVDLKASNVFKKPRFIQELFQTIIESNYPLFIELMDKKYFIAVNICSFYLLRELEFPSYDLFPGRFLAGLIADHFDINILIYYSEMCLHPSKENFIQFAVLLYEECLLEINKNTDHSPFISLLLMVVGEDIKEARRGELDDSIVKRFTPPSDYSKRGKVISMLPHVSAFTNLYARMNYVVSENIEIEVIHDELAHFDEILKSYEASFRSNKLSDMLMENQTRHPCTNYMFTKRFYLKFAQSITCSGIQVADVVAGFCTKYFNATQRSQRNDDLCYGETISMLKEFSNKGDGQGLNIVSSAASVNKFYSI